MSQIKEKYYNFLYNLLIKTRKIDLLDVDFNKSWWNVALIQKFSLFHIICSQVFVDIFYTIFPLGIIYFISSKNLNGIELLIAVYLAIVFLEFSIWYVNSIYSNRILYSIQYSAHKYFLTVDPVHHTTKSSG